MIRTAEDVERAADGRFEIMIGIEGENEEKQRKMDPLMVRLYLSWTFRLWREKGLLHGGDHSFLITIWQEIDRVCGCKQGDSGVK